jgi:hypothetical protein
MATTSDIVQIGPFNGGLNTYSDPTAVLDSELVMAENLELDLDGSLVQRPPFVPAAGLPLDLSAGNMTLLGYYYAAGGTPYLIGTDGNSSTYYFTGTSWVLITSTIAASAITQYSNLLYLQAPLSSVNPGGSWSPSAGFTAINAIPKGSTIIAHKSRLWAASGQSATAAQNGTRIYLSKIADPTTWDGTFIDIGPGDGQNIVKIVKYFDDLLIFKAASIYRFAFSTDPATGAPSQLSPTIGLTTADAVVNSDSILYFVYSDKVYQISNYQITQINQKVPLIAGTNSNTYYPVSLGLFNNRLIVSYYDTMFVYSLRTQRWTTWKSSKYGSIGKIIELNLGSATHTAIAHVAAPTPASVVRSYNQVANPKISGSDTTGYGVFNSGNTTGVNLTTASTGAQLNNTPGWTGTPVAIRAAATAVGSYLEIRYNNSNQSGSVMGNFSPNTLYTAIASVRGNGGVISAAMTVQYMDGDNNIIQQYTGDNVTLATTFSVTRRPFVTSRVPAGTAWVRLIVRGTGAVVSGSSLDATLFQMNNAATPQQYYDGDTVNDLVSTYQWNGPANASYSRLRNSRTGTVLAITDAFSSSAGESMTCTLVTKNYDYQSSSMFKRMFYWGVDASYRSTLRAYARSVRPGTFPTWDGLLATKWSDLLGFTWNSIGTADSSSLLTSADTSEYSSMRTFTKLGSKSFRFRQVSFRLEFDSDGTSASGPVRIFAIITRVSTKQTVSKQVS